MLSNFAKKVYFFLDWRLLLIKENVLSKLEKEKLGNISKLHN
jgi:hypothetical protein